MIPRRDSIFMLLIVVYSKSASTSKQKSVHASRSVKINDEGNSDEGSPLTISGLFHSAPRLEYVIPPIPVSLGRFDMNNEHLVDRNERASRLVETFITQSCRDASNSEEKARNVPVARQGDRVQVSAEISGLIGASRCSRDVVVSISNNLSQIERALQIRQKMLSLMNDNGDGVLVAQVSQVDINNARSISTTK